MGVVARARRALGRVGGRNPGWDDLLVGGAMNADLLAAEPDEPLRAAAWRIVEADRGAAIVSPDGESPGIVTARDFLDFVAAGGHADAEPVASLATADARSTSPNSTLGDAAREMVRGGFRHLIVREGGRTVGLLSMRDVVRTWVEARATPHVVIPIRTTMNTDVVEVSEDETVGRTAELMSEHAIAAAVVEDGERRYPGIFTERELLERVAAGGDLGAERVGDHLARQMTFSAPGWSLKQAAEAMTKGGFQHVVVVDRYEVRGVLAMRDVVHAWVAAADDDQGSS